MTGKVLVVDDVVQNVKLLEAKLTSEYYTVFSAYNGKECLDQVIGVMPDIILLDVMMPEMDGFETCERLKSSPETAHIPVVMVTALSEQEDRVRGLEAGANDFITKPINEVHLFARVKSLIRIKMMLDELRMRDKTGAEFGLVGRATMVPSGEVTGRIMVIDDDVVQLKNIREMLEAKGHYIETSGPDDAVEKVMADNFGLIIISTQLDDADGLRLGMQIRSDDSTRNIPILILVDEDDRALLIKAMEIGIDDYLITPIEKNELIARTKTQLRRKNFQDALSSSYQENLSAAVIDSLTKLYNRRYLDAHLHNIVEGAKEKKSQLSIMSLDIDHFKLVNDKPGWGHHIGDEVLIEVAARIMQSIRSTDLATRPGGEEFVIIMPNTELSKAQAVAERTRAAMADTPFKISAEPGELSSSISIGVATLDLEGDDSASGLLKRSDEALYTAKNGGRNQVVVSGQEQKW